MTRKSGTHVHVTYGIAVSTLLGRVSSAHRNLHHWTSNQQPQYAKPETLPLGHRFMSHVSDAELTFHRDNARPLDLMCLSSYLSIYLSILVASHLSSHIYLYILVASYQSIYPPKLTDSMII